MNRKVRISLIGVLVLLLLGSLMSLYLVHSRVWNVREALEQLVSSGTNGQYRLFVNEYSVKLNPFKITFDSLQILRADSSKADVKQVTVRHLVLATGSFLNFLSTGQLEIDTLEIEEPMIELTPGGKPKSKGVHFMQQIVKLYPAVLKTLEHFDVAYFVVKRASVDIHQEKKVALQLSLIDLLIENWNVKDLRADRQLRLAMGRQQVSLAKGDFTFSAFEYNFRNRELHFSDFQYSSRDSITQARLTATGDYLAFKHLDYHELFHNQRLVYQKIHFQHPTLYARLRMPAEKKNPRDNKSKISDFVAHTMSALSLDSVSIANAAIHFTLLTGTDSITIDLPDISLKTNQIRVEPDQPFHIGDFEIEMNHTRLSMKNDFAVSFSNLHLGYNKKLRVENLVLSDLHTGNKIAVVPTLELKQLDLLSMLGTKKLEPAGLEIRDAQIWIESRTPRKKQSGAAFKYPEFNLGALVLHNAAVTYQGDTETVRVQGVSTVLTNVRANAARGVTFSLKQFVVGAATVELPAKQISLRSEIVRVQGQTISVKRVEVARNELRILVNDLLAVHTNDLKDPRTVDHAHWKSIGVGHVEISGTPEFTTSKSPSRFELPVAVGQVEVSNILFNLHRGDTTLTGAVADLMIKNITHNKDTAFGFDAITGTTKNLKLKSSQLDAEVQHISMNWPQSITMDGLQYRGGENQVQLDNFQIRDIQHQATKWRTASVSARGVWIDNAGVQARLDSIHVDDFAWVEKKPHTAFVEIFHPVVQVKETQQPQDSPKQPKRAPLDKLMPDRFVIHPGRVELPANKVVSFGTIQGSLVDKKISIQSIGHTLRKSVVRVSNVVLTRAEVSIDSITLKPNEQWYAENNVEDGKLNLALAQLTLSNQLFDSLLFHQKVYPTALEVADFNLFVARDKRLPDPPEVEKPWSLSSMIILPEALPIQTVKIKDGDIRIEEISDKTGQTGFVTINDIRATIGLGHRATVDAQARLYNQGKIQLKYLTIHPDTFRLEVRLNDFDLTQLNAMVVPSLSIEIKSGTVNRFLAEIIATKDKAVGAAGISYQKLHIAVNKKGEAERNKILSVISDELVLRNSKNWVISEFAGERIKHKSVFNYWVRLSAKGAIDATLNGR
ncbi:MAG: hypothetical protein U5K54_00125 [Cytophagales bacterium]|nr:hypothetical protein [Cytophagales bacterium]